jgi:hypothetical protein
MPDQAPATTERGLEVTPIGLLECHEVREAAE